MIMKKIKYRSLFEESSTLVSKALIDYDEVLTPFGGINRNFIFLMRFYIKFHIQLKKSTNVGKIKLDTVIKEQDMFELISTKKV